MKKINKVLIIAPYQFGELSDCFYWAKYAANSGKDVTYIGYRYAHRRMKERVCAGVKVKGVYHYDNRLLLGLCFFLRIIYEILIHGHYNIIVCKFPHVEKLVKIFPKRNIVLDIRTLSVSSNDKERKSADEKTRNIAIQFPACSVISEGVRDKLGIKATILPLGAECISTVSKEFSTLKLFYIGTFDNRNLTIFLKGLSLFNKKYSLPISFDIVGGGNIEEENAIKNVIVTEKLKCVKLHGYLTHEEGRKFFDTCNVGVCYVPMTEYYEHQPPTKLYEYLLSGMACIATNTKSNRDVMTPELGVLIDDDVNSVCEGIYKLYNQCSNYSTDKIISASMNYHWSCIVKNIFLKMFS